MSEKFEVKHVKTEKFEGWGVVREDKVYAVESTKEEADCHAQVLNDPTQQVPPVSR